MPRILMAPVHLDALFLPHEQSVLEPMADFSRLPYCDGARDVNPDCAPLSEEILSQPLETPNLLLKAGVHLHWALPDALTRGVHSAHGVSFPAVPNRWMVVRTVQNEVKRWIVESDYLFPPNTNAAEPSVTYPFRDETQPQPFRFLGRKLAYEAWRNQTGGASYLDKLTAIGYGEPNFAAFYPNCHSIFGFHDDDFDAGRTPHDVKYELLGWYEDAGQDALRNFTEDFGWALTNDDIISWPNFLIALNGLAALFPQPIQTLFANNSPSPQDKARVLEAVQQLLAQRDLSQREPFKNLALPEDAQALQQSLAQLNDRQIVRLNRRVLEAKLTTQVIVASALKWHHSLEQSFAWTTDGDHALPESMVCYAQLQFATTNFNDARRLDLNAAVAVGNTSTEALSAYLAQTLPATDRLVLEEQLEALHLAPQLESRTIDLGAKFQEARHEKGFTAVTAGKLWTIQAGRTRAVESEGEAREKQTHDALPETLHTPLQQLNHAQQEYDRAQHEIAALRAQLFADWHKYLLCAYPPEDAPDEYPEMEEVRYFIERCDLAPLQWRIADAGTLALQKNATGEIIGAQAWRYLFRLEAKLREELQAGRLETLRLLFEQEGYTLVADARLLASGRHWLILGAGQNFVLQFEANGLSVYQAEASSATHAARLAAAFNATHAAMVKAQELIATDIKDWRGLQQALQTRQTPPLQNLWFRFSAAVQDMITGPAWADEQTQLMLAAFNRVLYDTTFYDATSFASVTLPEEAQRLLEKLTHWSQEETLRCNRLLLEAALPELLIKRPHYFLRQKSAPRYWQANDPVVLLVDEALQPTPRHGEDGRLHPEGLLVCQIHALDNRAIHEQEFALRAKIAALAPNAGEERIGFSQWTTPPWHPYLLEWAVEVLPIDEMLFQTGVEHAATLDRGEILVALKQAFQANDCTLSAEAKVSFMLPQQHWEITDRDANNNARTFIIQREDNSLRVACGPEDFITSNYALTENAVELSLRAGRGRLAQRANTYTGRSILTPQAKPQLQQALEAFLEKKLLPDFYKEQNIDTALRTNDFFEKHRGEIMAWYTSKPTAQRDAVGEQMLAVAAKLSEPNFNPLAQSLNGFNDALLMHKRTLQLPVADPLAFDDYQPFAERVRELVQNANRSAPQPLNDFNPIRSGFLRLLELRLVDTFGRVQNVKLDRVLATEVMQAEVLPHLVELAPRLVQPARMHFRWLAAHDENASEAIEHHASTPVCGWLLPNHLESSLMVFNAQGQALGAINRRGLWMPSPGARRILASDISNPQLKQVVSYLLAQGENFFVAFMSAMESASDNIEPESDDQHEALTLLFGKPLAVVRASLDLQLKGLPAINQDWSVFRHDMERNAAARQSMQEFKVAREDEDFPRTRFPIRLGEYRQLNDGLVGFWQEEAQPDGGYQFARNRFYVNDSVAAITSEGYDDDPQLDSLDLDTNTKAILLALLQAAPIKKQSLLARLKNGAAIWQSLLDADYLQLLESSPQIVYYADAPDLLQSVAEAPRTMTMLVDPRGVVHATCGILPAKAIGIPSAQYAEALRRIEVTFMTAPIVTEKDKIKLPLPSEPGFVWSWLAKENGVWHTSTEVEPVSTVASFAGTQVLKEGWLKLQHEREKQ